MRYEFVLDGYSSQPLYVREGEGGRGMILRSYPKRNVSFLAVNYAVSDGDAAAFAHILLEVL
jgi:hypothetical protein